MISVIVPTYNQSQYLRRAIESVWAQDIDDLEIVVVDDGSTDDTAVILRELSKDGRLRSFRQRNLGPAAARNRGISESHGELIAFLDSDDFWLPGKLKAQLNALQRTGNRFSYCGCKVIDVNGNVIALAPVTADDGRFICLVWGNRFATPTAVVQRSLLNEVGLFDETLRTGEDWDLWLRLSSKTKGACIAEPLVAVTGSPRWRADETQLRAFEHSTTTVLERLFHLASDQPELISVIANKSRIVSWHFAVLAKSYLQALQFRNSFRCAVRSMASSPRGLIYLIPGARSPRAAGESPQAPSPDVTRTEPSVSSVLEAPQLESDSGTPSDFSISVVIRAHNRAEMTKDALDSVLRQNVAPKEILVIDNGSTDETPNVIQSYQQNHPLIRSVRITENRGAYYAAQVGVEESKCAFVAFLDCDDVWLPTHLEETVAALRRNPGASMVFSAYGLMNAEGKTLVEHVRESPLEYPPFRSLVLKHIVVQPTRTVFRRQAVIDAGGFPPFYVDDWALIVLIAAKFPDGIIQLPTRTALFRIHGSHSYSNPGALRDSLEEATEYIFDQLPPTYAHLKRPALGMNLLHSAVFHWQAAEAASGWRCLLRALALYPSCVFTKSFWAALGRLIVPTSLGRGMRKAKREFQQRNGRNSSSVSAAANTR